MVLFLSAVLAAVGITSLVYAAHYQPLRMGPGGGFAIYDADGHRLSDAVRTDHDSAGPGEVQVATFRRRGSTLHITYRLRNAGPFAVRITRLRPPYPEGTYRHAEVRMSDVNDSRVVRVFHPVTLRPGEYREFRLLVTPDDCVYTGDPRMRTIAQTQFVDYRFFGMSQRAELDYHGQYSVKAWASCAPRSGG